MKAVLISIRPEWCAKIVSGEKTIEVRKTRPRLPTPFKSYIYCTAGGIKRMPIDYLNENFARAKVIGEFVCDKIFDIYEFSGSRFWLNEALLKDTCLSYDEIKKYAENAKEIYGWHISELKIYDEPKKLSAFHRQCTPACNFSEECGGVQDGEHCPFPMERPPQSWCYVEELT